jgi:hypothetical protein
VIDETCFGTPWLAGKLACCLFSLFDNAYILAMSIILFQVELWAGLMPSHIIV